MKWTKKTELKVDDEQRVEKFLFLPMTIGSETRWLEWACIHQRVVRVDSCFPPRSYRVPPAPAPIFHWLEWKNVRFVDNRERYPA